jgi:hypothetical protein
MPFDHNTRSFDFTKLKTGLSSIAKPSANISTSSNGLIDGTGIVWLSQPGLNKSQIFTAVDANDITKELWNCTQNLSRDSSGGFMKFAVPTYANGKVYLANSTGSINVYGIIDTLRNFLIVQPAPYCQRICRPLHPVLLGGHQPSKLLI